jgi:hypothetical protein
MSAERKYLVLPNDMLDTLDWECFQNTKGNCPKYATHFIVVYVGNKPPCVYGHDTYTEAQMLDKKKDINDPIYEDPDLI